MGKAIREWTQKVNLKQHYAFVFVTLQVNFATFLKTGVLKIYTMGVARYRRENQINFKQHQYGLN